MSALFKLGLMLAAFAVIINGRAVEKDAVSCTICMYMGNHIDKIEDLTFDELLAALLASCDTWGSTSWRHLCEGYAHEHLDDIYMWMATHPDDLKPINVPMMCQDIGSC